MKRRATGIVLCTMILLFQSAMAGNGRGKVALTYDDGPDPKLTTRLLDILKDNSARATFFPIGEKVDKYPLVISRMAREGHEIGNHGWGHLKMTQLGEAGMAREISLTTEALSRVAGVSPRLFRPPHGLVDETLRETARRTGGLATVTWSLTCGDWMKTSAKHIETQILQKIGSGDVVLMHDINPQTVEAMERVIPELRKRGYELVTVSELLEEKGARRRAH